MRAVEIMEELPHVGFDYHDKRDALRKELQTWAEPVRQELGLKYFRLYAGRDLNDIELDLIVADEKSTGAGTAAMQRLCSMADEKGMRIILKVADRSSGKNYGTTSRARLVKFYHRFGFVTNSGANKDKFIPYFQMYRRPKSLQT